MSKITLEQLQVIAYDLYVEEWLREHISTERLLNALRNYHKGVLSGDYSPEYDFNAYVQESGFDGELYVCFDEFIESEFEDREYMYELLEDETFVQAYDKHMIDSKINEIYGNLSSEEKDKLYRIMWKDHVMTDIKTYVGSCPEYYPNITEEDVILAAEMYINGDYSCEQDYWTNISYVIDRAIEERLRGEE